MDCATDTQSWKRQTHLCAPRPVSSDEKSRSPVFSLSPVGRFQTDWWHLHFFLFGSDTDCWLLIFWFLSLVALGIISEMDVLELTWWKAILEFIGVNYKEFFTLLLAPLLSLFGDNLCKVYLYSKCKIQWFLIKLSSWVF